MEVKLLQSTSSQFLCFFPSTKYHIICIMDEQIDGRYFTHQPKLSVALQVTMYSRICAFYFKKPAKGIVPVLIVYYFMMFFYEL